MAQESGASAGNTFVFHFSGGQDSGQSLRFDKQHSTYNTGCVLWQKTQMGTIGHQFEWDIAGVTHHYVVTDKRVTKDAIIVVCEVAEAGDLSELY